MTEEHRGPPASGWAAFFTEAGPVLLRVATRVLGPHAVTGISAEDVVNEALTKLIAKGIPQERDPLPYAITTVKRTGLDEIKAARRINDGEVDVDQEIGEHDIEAAVDDALLAHDLVQAIERLPAREAHAIREKVINGRHWQEVAAELGDVTTVQGVGKIVSRGLSKLCKQSRFADLFRSVSTSQGPPTKASPPPGTTP